MRKSVRGHNPMAGCRTGLFYDVLARRRCRNRALHRGAQTAEWQLGRRRSPPRCRMETKRILMTPVRPAFLLNGFPRGIFRWRDDYYWVPLWERSEQPACRCDPYKHWGLYILPTVIK